MLSTVEYNFNDEAQFLDFCPMNLAENWESSQKDQHSDTNFKPQFQVECPSKTLKNPQQKPLAHRDRTTYM